LPTHATVNLILIAAYKSPFTLNILILRKKLNVFFCTMKFPHYFIGALQCNLSNFLACSNVKMLQVNFCSAPLKTSLSGA